MVGRKQAKRSKWLMAYVVVLIISYLDWMVSTGFVCKEVKNIKIIR